MTMAVVGVDGCKAGWFAVRLESTGEWDSKVFHKFDSLWQDWGNASLILVDIPIGLPDAKKKQRTCDSDARKLLGPRKSSVFSPPSRAAFEPDSHQSASDANKLEVGKGLSRQSWSLTPRSEMSTGYSLKTTQ